MGVETGVDKLPGAYTVVQECPVHFQNHAEGREEEAGPKTLAGHKAFEACVGANLLIVDYQAQETTGEKDKDYDGRWMPTDA